MVVNLMPVAIDFETVLLDAIQEAHKLNKKIIKLGIPPKFQKEMIRKAGVRGSKRIIELWGIKVVTSKTLQITTEIFSFKSLPI